MSNTRTNPEFLETRILQNTPSKEAMTTTKLNAEDSDGKQLEDPVAKHLMWHTLRSGSIMCRVTGDACTPGAIDDKDAGGSDDDGEGEISASEMQPDASATHRTDERFGIE